MTTPELKARTKDFALRVIRLVNALPNTVKRQIESLLKEASELVAIMAASRKSAIGNRKSAIH
jgi:hypothetical protein